MSILDKASLIQIPSGYKSTKLYSLRPTNGDGDFTFARSSSATRVNAEGLIETAQVLGSEEVTNGDFATDSDWTKTGLVTIANGVASFVDNGTNTNTGISQNILTANKTYKITFDITRYVAGNLQFVIGATTHSYNISSGVGSYVAYYNVTGSGSTNLFRLKRWGGYPNFDFDIDNVSVKEVIENDVPRLDYSGGASCASLLLEGQRTNLVTYSESFDNAYWTKNGTSVTSGFTSPDGTANAFKLVENSSNSAHRIFNGSGLSVSGNVSMSVFAKKGGRDFIRLTNNNLVGAFFDLNNGVVLGVSSGITAKIEDFGNDWYRCSITQTGVANERLIVYLSNNGIDTSYQGDGESGVYLWGAMLEVGSFPTSYIKTNGESGGVTRAAETCNGSGDAATFNDSEGVLMAEISALVDSTSGGVRRLSLSNGTNDNRIQILFSNVVGRIDVVVKSGGLFQIDTGFLGYNTTESNKIAIRYGSGVFKVYINGLSVFNDAGVSFSSISLNNLRFSNPFGTETLESKTKQIQYFDSVLDSAQLEQLTSWDSFRAMAEGQLYTIE